MICAVYRAFMFLIWFSVMLALLTVLIGAALAAVLLAVLMGLLMPSRTVGGQLRSLALHTQQGIALIQAHRPD